jgi:hypothetical protein
MINPHILIIPALFMDKDFNFFIYILIAGLLIAIYDELNKPDDE